MANSLVETGRPKLNLLLSVVDRLECLEIRHAHSMLNLPLADYRQADLSYLSSLSSSFGSLQHLRLLDFSHSEGSPPVIVPLELFTCLKVISLDYSLLQLLSQSPNLIPSSLEKILLISYLPSVDNPNVFQEDIWLGQTLNGREWPSLKLEVVPSSAVDPSGDDSVWDGADVSV